MDTIKISLMTEQTQFNYPIWPKVKRVFNDWTEIHVGGKFIPVHKTIYVTYVRKEFEGRFYLQLCKGEFVSGKHTDTELHNERALNALNVTAYFADRFERISDPDMTFSDGTKAYTEHDDQRPEREYLLYRHGIDINPEKPQP